MLNNSPTPKSLGYYFPAEFAKHEAMWLSWPHKEESWPGKIASIYSSYCEFIKVVSATERVCINVLNDKMRQSAVKMLELSGVDLSRVQFFIHPTNDAWCRDHGPSFLIRNNKEQPKAIVDWNINAWGGKYPPYDLDDAIPTHIAKALDLPVFYPNIIMEGGSVDFNGAGTVLTSKCCLLNPNRNTDLSKDQIERYLCNFYGVEQGLLVSEGIICDDIFSSNLIILIDKDLGIFILTNYIWKTLMVLSLKSQNFTSVILVTYLRVIKKIIINIF